MLGGMLMFCLFWGKVFKLMFYCLAYFGTNSQTFNIYLPNLIISLSLIGYFLNK